MCSGMARAVSLLCPGVWAEAQRLAEGDLIRSRWRIPADETAAPARPGRRGWALMSGPCRLSAEEAAADPAPPAQSQAGPGPTRLVRGVAPAPRTAQRRRRHATARGRRWHVALSCEVATAHQAAPDIALAARRAPAARAAALRSAGGAPRRACRRPCRPACLPARAKEGPSRHQLEDAASQRSLVTRRDMGGMDAT
jgi:hypothetical protein